MRHRSHFEALDAVDPLAGVRTRFDLPAGLIYLDGNSLGARPAHVPEAVARVVEEWGADLIGAWDRRGWWTLAERVGERIASLIGAPAGSVLAGDTTTVSLFKAVGGARRMRPDRRVLLTDSGGFPTDLYALGSVAQAEDADVRVVDPEAVEAAIDAEVAAVCLAHVDYRTGRRHDMRVIGERARQAGALTVWDLSHSAGAMDLDVSDADFAVGCGYKYLNGGPGAPAYVYVHPEHLDAFANPIAGWWGHAEPFAMRPDFEPAAGIRRLGVGTQPIISLVALDAALEAFEGIDLREVRAKSEKLVGGFIDLVDECLPGCRVVTPREPSARGSQVSIAHPRASEVMEALVARGVVGDVRPPDLLRFGFAPLYNRHVEVWEAVAAMVEVLQTAEAASPVAGR